MPVLRKRNCAVYFLLFFLLCVCSSFGQSTRKRLELIHADVFIRETVDGEIQHRLEGNVKLRQDDTTIETHMATHFLNQDVYSLVGKVRIYDKEHTLLADTVFYYEKQKIQVATGNVKVITKTDWTTADRMTYNQLENRLQFEGNVRIFDNKEGRVLRGGKAEYWRSQERGKIYDNPVLIKFDSLNIETTRIIADTIHIFEGGKKTIAEGAVRIIQPEIEATCGKALFLKTNEQIILQQKPKVIHQNQEITGDSLLLYLDHSRLKRAIVLGNAMATSDADTLSKGRWVNRLTGQAMTFFFENSRLTRVTIENQATSVYHIIENDQYKGVNEVSGDKIIIHLENDTVKRILVRSSPGQASGKFTPTP